MKKSNADSVVSWTLSQVFLRNRFGSKFGRRLDFPQIDVFRGFLKKPNADSVASWTLSQVFLRNRFGSKFGRRLDFPQIDVGCEFRVFS